VSRFSAGAVFHRSLGIWSRNLAPFLLLTLAITLPGHLLGLAVLAGTWTTSDPGLDQALPQLLVSTLLYLASGAICFGVFQELRGKPVGFTRCVAVGLVRLVDVLGAGFVAGLVILIGTIALILPGLVLWAVLFVVVPTAVLEGTGAIGSMQRSASLTAGNRWPVLAIVLLLFLVNLAAMLLVAATLGAGGPGYFTAQVALTTLSGSFGAVTSTVAYHDLRLVKEGVSPDDAGDVFE
jgi:hypothetical protein